MAFVSLKSIIKSQLPVGKVAKPKRIRVVAQIPAMNATVTPPLGPLLGQFGLNIMEFCKEFNQRTNNFEKDLLLTTVIYIEPNKQFSFDIKLPNMAYFLNLYMFHLQENGFRINIRLLLFFLYDLSLLYFVYNKLYYNQEILINFIYQLMGTLRSYNLFFYVKYKYYLGYRKVFITNA